MIDLNNFNNLVLQLQATTSRIDKENILANYKNDTTIKEILNFIFNSRCKINKIIMPKCRHKEKIKTFLDII